MFSLAPKHRTGTLPWSSALLPFELSALMAESSPRPCIPQPSTPKPAGPEPAGPEPAGDAASILVCTPEVAVSVRVILVFVSQEAQREIVKVAEQIAKIDKRVGATDENPQGDPSVPDYNFLMERRAIWRRRRSLSEARGPLY